MKPDRDMEGSYMNKEQRNNDEKKVLCDAVVGYLCKEEVDLVERLRLLFMGCQCEIYNTLWNKSEGLPDTQEALFNIRNGFSKMNMTAVVSMLCSILETAPEYKKNTRQFCVEKCHVCGEESQSDGYCDMSLYRSYLRALKRIDDSKLVRHRQAINEGSKYKKNSYITQRNGRPYDFIQLCMADWLVWGKFRIFEITYSKKLDENKLYEAYQSFIKLISEIEQIKDDRLYSIYCMTLFKYENAFRPVLLLKMAYYITALEDEELSGKLLELLSVIFGRGKCPSQLIIDNKYIEIEYKNVLNYDLDIQCAILSLLTLKMEKLNNMALSKKILFEKLIVDESIGIYSTLTKNGMERGLFTIDFVRTAKFFKEEYPLLKALDCKPHLENEELTKKMLSFLKNLYLGMYPEFKTETTFFTAEMEKKKNRKNYKKTSNEQPKKRRKKYTKK